MTLLQLQQALAPVFQKHGVSFAYLFGSRARGEETENSDYDIAVYLHEMDINGNYLTLYSSLAKALDVNEDKIDIVFLNKIKNEILKYIITQEGQIIFEENKEIRVQKEVRFVMESKDFVEKHFSRFLVHAI